MNVSLTPEARVPSRRGFKRVVLLCQFIREGLRLRKRQEQLRLQELRQDIQAGLDSGEPTPEYAAVKEKAQQRRRQSNLSNGGCC